MKKIMFVLAAMLLVGAVSVNAQEDKKDKAAVKAEKAEKKAKAKAEKADKNAAKMEKLMAEYDEYVKNYKPLEKTGVADADLVVEQINTLSSGMNGIYDKIGYIKVETTETTDEYGQPSTSVRVYDKNTGKDIDKVTAANNFKAVSKPLAEMTTKTTALGPALAKINPMNMVAIAPQAKEILKRGKMLLKVVPAISAQVKTAKEALKIQ